MTTQPTTNETVPLATKKHSDRTYNSTNEQVDVLNGVFWEEEVTET